MPVDPSKWEGLLGQLDSGGAGGVVYFLKQQKTRVRLVLPQDAEDETQFYAETSKHYQGKESTAYLVLGMILGTSEKGDQNVDPNKVRAIRLPKTALRGIVGMLAEGHDLFDEDEGHGITIEKIGGKGSDRTSYNVTVSPKAVPIDPSGLEWPDKDIYTIATEEAIRSQERDEKAANPKGPKANGRNRPQEIDDDEDLPF